MSFRDIQEDLVFVLVSVFSIYQNLVKILPCRNLVSSKSFLFFPFLYCFIPCFSCFYSRFSCFLLKNDVSRLVSFPIYAHFLCLIPSCFPFPVLNSILFFISRSISCLVLFLKELSRPPLGQTQTHQYLPKGQNLSGSLSYPIFRLILPLFLPLLLKFLLTILFPGLLILFFTLTQPNRTHSYTNSVLPLSCSLMCDHKLSF